MSDPSYRTISEVATLVGVPQHVLRFWETKFAEIAPLKRGGNRRYYRPADVAVIERIARLLRDDGYTIKGVQKLFAAAAPEPPRQAAPVAAPPAEDARVAGNAAILTRLAAIRTTLIAELAAARAL